MQNDISGLGNPQDAFYRWSKTTRLPEIARAKGVYFWDTDGNRYLDACSGPVACNIGHANPRVLDAMRKQAGEYCFANFRHTRNRPNIELSEKLANLCGSPFEKSFFLSGGSEAVDMALKLARCLALSKGDSQRTRIISCHPSYHGGTIATAAISGDDQIESVLGDMAVYSKKISAPLTFRRPDGKSIEEYSSDCADELEKAIIELGPGKVLAFVVEPVGGLASGANVPHDVYFSKIRRICDRYGVYLIYDEVLCGAGRTGSFLAARHWSDAVPDIVIMAKGISAGYTPIGVIMVSAEMQEALQSDSAFAFGHTFCANPLSCAITLAVLEEVEQENIVNNVRQQGERLLSGLHSLMSDFQVIADVRGKGLLTALEIVRDTTTKEVFPAELNAPALIQEIGLQFGLLLYSRRTNNGRFGDWLMISPALNITDTEIDELLHLLHKTFSDFTDRASARGFMRKTSMPLTSPPAAPLLSSVSS